MLLKIEFFFLIYFFFPRCNCANDDVLENHPWTINVQGQKGWILEVWCLTHVYWKSSSAFTWASSKDTSGAEVNQRLQERHSTQKVKALLMLKTLLPDGHSAHPTWAGHSTKLRTEGCSWTLCTPMVLSWGLLHPTCGNRELERNYNAVMGTSNLSLPWQGGPHASLKNWKVHFYCIVLHTRAVHQHLDRGRGRSRQKNMFSTVKIKRKSPLNKWAASKTELRIKRMLKLTVFRVKDKIKWFGLLKEQDY